LTYANSPKSKKDFWHEHDSDVHHANTTPITSSSPLPSDGASTHAADAKETSAITNSDGLMPEHEKGGKIA